MNQNNIVLSNCVKHGYHYDCDDFVLQKIDHKRHDHLNQIYYFYKKYNLTKHGFVQADLFSQEGDLFLKIKKHIQSYSNEWTLSMAKDATLFHLGLFKKTINLNLSLKSSSLQNIIFDYTQPIFHDLMSLSIRDEETFLSLSIDDVNLRSVTEKILLITELLKKGRYQNIREFLYEERAFFVRKKMNELFASDLDLKASCEESMKVNTEKLSTKKNFIDQCDCLCEIVTQANVNVDPSFYAKYYEDRDENFSLTNRSTWKAKQHNVYKILKNYYPHTVLDIGANSGWFSFLAEQEGANVIATDIDESAIDLLYQQAKSKNSKILSLFMPFSSTTSRIASDMVLCLALSHHLVFKQNMKFDDIFKILSTVTKNILVFEFVGHEDTLVKYYPQFYKYMNEESKQNYTLDLAIKSGLNYFSEVEVLDSHPQTRKLLVFKK